MNYHQGRNSGPNLDGGEKIRTPVNFIHPSPDFYTKIPVFSVKIPLFSCLS